MPNLKPKTEQLRKFKAVGETQGKLSRNKLQFHVEQEIYDLIMKLPTKERMTLLRKWVREGCQSDLNGGEQF